MKKINTTLSFTEFDNVEELSQSIQIMIQQAEKNLSHSYSPYSLFKVSAAVLLDNNQVVLGTNQENVAYPSGLCAERVAVFAAKSTFPESAVQTIAIVTAQSNYTPFSPCGSCRQALMEYEIAQKKPIQVILKSGNSKIWMFDSITSLLPFAFNADTILKKE